MNNVLVSVVIVSYNTKDTLIKCLVAALEEIDKNKGEIIVVDNGSADGSVEAIKKLHIPNLKLIENKDNLGFAKANNIGISRSKGEYIFLLNSDAFLEKDSLSAIIAFASKHKNAGVVGPRLLNPDKTVQPSCFYFPGVFGAVKEFWLGKNGSFTKYVPQAVMASEVDAVVGAAFLIPRNVLERIGGLNEKYFFYFEDLDYCRRVKRLGYKVYYYPKAEVIHGHGTSGKGDPRKMRKLLIRSSVAYFGLPKYLIVNAVIWSGQKWQKLKKLF